MSRSVNKPGSLSLRLRLMVKLTVQGIKFGEASELPHSG